MVAGLTLGAVALACSRRDVPVISAIESTPEPTPSVTPANGSIQNVLPETPWPTLSPTPTEISRNPFLVENLDLSKEVPLTITLSLNGDVYTTNVDLRHYRNDMTPEEVDYLFNVIFKPGEGTAVSVDEKYGNVLIYIHSAYWRDEELEAEFLRKYIEGLFDATIMDDDDKEYFLERLASLEGVRITLVQEGGESAEFEIIAGVKIPHHQKPLFDADLKEVLDLVTTYGLGNPEGFEYFKENQGVLLTFCGWGPEEFDSRGHNDPEYRYAYTQYVLGLRPVSH